MSRRTKIIIAAIIALIIAILLALLFLRPSAQPAPAPENAPAATNAGGLKGSPSFQSPSFNANVATNAPVNAPAAPPKVDDKSSLRTVARSFTEMYGSFSNTANGQNILDAEYYMTDAMRVTAEQQVSDIRSSPASPQYFGVTTRAIIEPVIDEYDPAAGTAKVTVTARRIESGSTVAGGQHVYNQDISLKLMKVSDTWKVDSATWGPRP